MVRGACCGPLGTEASEYHNLLVEDGPEATRRVSTVWEMLQRSRGIDMLNLVNVRSDMALYGLLTQDWRYRMRARRLGRRLPAPVQSRIKAALTNLIRKSAV